MTQIQISVSVNRLCLPLLLAHNIISLFVCVFLQIASDLSDERAAHMDKLCARIRKVLEDRWEDFTEACNQLVTTFIRPSKTPALPTAATTATTPATMTTTSSPRQQQQQWPQPQWPQPSQQHWYYAFTFHMNTRISIIIMRMYNA